MARCPRLLVLAALATLLAAAARVYGATAAASAPAPAPSADCTDALLSLAGCLGYVEAGSTDATPDPSCCSGLQDVVRTGQVACLCQVFHGGQDFGISLNMTKALQLPAACKVQTPPVSKCNVSLAGVPSASPVAAPSAGAPVADQSPPPSTPSGSGSPAGAATGSDSGTQGPAPARSGAASLSASSQTFFAAATAAAILSMYRAL